MALEGVTLFVFSSTCATYGEPIETPNQRNASADARSTATASRSWRSSGRCRTSSARYGIHSVALRYFNAAGADPDGEIGEDHSPEIHIIPRAIEAATGGRGPAGVRRRLPDAGRHLPARLHPRERPGRRAREGARGDRRRPARRASTTSAPGTRIRCAKSSTPCERVTGRAGAVDARARGARATRRCSTPPRTRRRANCAGRRASPISTAIVGTAWHWHQRTAARVRNGAPPVNSAVTAGPAVRLRAPLQGAAGLGRRGDGALRRRVGGPRGPDQDHLRQRPAGPVAAVAWSPGRSSG